MKPHTAIHSLNIVLIGSFLCLLPLSAGGNPTTRSRPNQPSTDLATQMDPYSVSALFSAIEVRFKLSGENLFDPGNDTVEKANIVKTEIRDFTSTPLVKSGDQIISLDDVPLAGRTLRQIGEQLANARREGMPRWTIRRGLQSIDIKFDGDWLIPLPGLKR